MEIFRTYIMSEWARIYKEQYSFLKKFPSSYVLSHVAIFEKNPKQFNTDYLIKLSNGLDLSKQERTELWDLYTEESTNIKYTPYTERHRMLSNYLTTVSDERERRALTELLEEWSIIETPKAKDIRPIFFKRIKDRFDEKPKSVGGGCWSVNVKIKKYDATLTLDFGGFRKFTYWIDLVKEAKAESDLKLVSYEDFMGLGDPDWDLMRIDQLEDHSKHFIQVIEKIITAIEISNQC